MFDPPTRIADDGSGNNSGSKWPNSQNEKTTTEMLDSFFDEILKEAKKKKVNEKKNAGKPCSNEFLNFQRDQFSHQM